MSSTRISSSVRRAVKMRAKSKCEYCLLPDFYTLIPFHIDHVISEKHDGSSEMDNLAYSCPDCNIKKGSDIATLTEDTKLLVPLYNPRKDRFSDHFSLDGNWIIGLSNIGKATVRFMKLNADSKLENRFL